MDESHHDWFEGRGAKCVLEPAPEGFNQGAYPELKPFRTGIDDATGMVFNLARFSAYEGTMPAVESFKGYMESYGLPLRHKP